MNIALIVFAGSGTRIHSDVPKQFIKINDQELVVYTINKFIENPHIDEIVLVTSKDYVPYVENLVEKNQLSKIVKIVEGGATRQESVKLGLLAIDYDKDINILIHDGDRPLVSNTIINQCISYLEEYQATCPFLPIENRLKEISNSGRTRQIGGVEVDIQTPQAFKFGLIKSKHLELENKSFSDDIGLVEDAVEVKFFEGENTNFKVTKDIDLEYIKRIILNHLYE